MMRKKPVEYEADGGISLTGLPVLVLALGCGAVALGWLASFIGQWFYLVFFFPLGLGFGLVFIGVAVSGVAKMRNLGVGALLGLLAGVLTMVSMHYFDYLRSLQGVPGGGDSLSFLQYLDQQATQGVVLGQRGGGFNLGYTGSWIYWVVEMLIVAGISLLGMVGSAMTPFCVKCDRWKEEKKLGTLDHDNPDLIKGFFTEGDLESLRPFVTQGSVPGRFHFTAHICPSCRHRESIVVKLEDKKSSDKEEETSTELAQLTFPGAALKEFEALFGGVRPRKEQDHQDDEDEEQGQRRYRLGEREPQRDKPDRGGESIRRPRDDD